MTDITFINSEAPVPLAVTSYGSIYPLTACCHAVGKGWTDDGGGVVCKGCFEWVSDLYGDCWKVDEERGWNTYRELLTDTGCTVAKADEIVAYARQRLAAN